MLKWMHTTIVWKKTLSFPVKCRLDVLNYITVIRSTKKELKEYLKKLEEND